MNFTGALVSCRQIVEGFDPIKWVGRVERVEGSLVACLGPRAKLREVCRIELAGGSVVYGEVVALKEKRVYVMAYQELRGIEVGDHVVALGHELEVGLSEDLKGRVVDALGLPLDGKPRSVPQEYRSVHGEPPPVLERRLIDQQLVTGVRVIDGILPVGKGQRVGIFSGSGLGKSTLLGMVARNTRAEVNVIALIGERGREVREFVEQNLGEEGLRHSVVVVSPSEAPPLVRIRGAYTATTIAEYFRDQGKEVLLLFDSVTRFALAQREIGLSLGEPPATRGYPPSVFTMLPKLLERSGVAKRSSITGLYTVLVEGDDIDEPISDAVRGILDGHIFLSRDLANRHHYPAVDVLGSVSRLVSRITTKETQEKIGILRRLLAVYAAKEDLIDVGAYAEGSDPEVDEAIAKIGMIRKFLMQAEEESVSLEETLSALESILAVSQKKVARA